MEHEDVVQSKNSTLENTSQAAETSNGTNAVPSWVPRIGKLFVNLEEAWNFWNFYAYQIGFPSRKKYENKSKLDGKATSCRYVCSKERFRTKDKRDHLAKCPRAEARIGFKVRMGLTLDRQSETYEIYDLVFEHNHVLQTPETAHLMPSQRSISEVQAFEIDMADGTGIRPRIAHELASKHAGGVANLGYTYRDHKNYLRIAQQKEMKYEEAGSLLQYFQNKVAENPSFFYALQLDKEEQIANIFWADAKMIIDYSHFGDVVTFDTTFGTNIESHPFGVFVGFNHFRETVIFGATLMYDESFESFKWLFDTFLSAHNQRQPRTIYTDQDIAMGKAIEKVLHKAWHGLCTWHIIQNAIKHLNRHKVNGSNVLSEFSACMSEYKDKTMFEQVFVNMRNKVHKQTWLDSIYKVKEKWAECYMKDVYTLGMRSTQLSESLNSDLKEYLNSELNILRFFKHFERAVQAKREKEINSEYESRDKVPQIKIRTPMLMQASKLYTPQLFEAFQHVYEKSMSAYAKLSCDGSSYIVGIGSIDEEFTLGEGFIVTVDFSENKVLCCCPQFELIRILYSHALKVLDLMNIKQLPEQYVLKRGTRGAGSGTVHDINGRSVLEDPKIDATCRYKFLLHKFIPLASKAAESEDSSLLVDGVLENVAKQLDENFKQHSKSTNNQTGTQAAIQVPENMSHVTGLKKKEKKNGAWKRKKTWVDRLSKKKKQEPIPTEAMQTQAGEPQIYHNYEIFGSYTQLLMGQSVRQELYSDTLLGNTGEDDGHIHSSADF